MNMKFVDYIFKQSLLTKRNKMGTQIRIMVTNVYTCDYKSNLHL
jgi:hypothetical protein